MKIILLLFYFVQFYFNDHWYVDFINFSFIILLIHLTK